jgi:hypothetical protein
MVQRLVAFVSPRTPLEEVMVGIWSEVLGLERIGIHDNFFDLGENPLLIIRVLSRVRQIFQVALPFRCLFEYPTIAELSPVLIAHETKSGQTKKFAYFAKMIEEVSDAA